ncbi:MAG: TlpA family protein disulfide reductase [Acidobacteriia bacterium]|nr:TlpA family protein disulfide reductase [Terriglobia bacterium]
MPRFVPILLLAVLLAGCNRNSTVGLVGTKAPDFTIKDSDRTVSLHDFKGKTVLLNFWATNCPPCVEEMPSLVRLQKLKGPGLVVLAVSTDQSEQEYHRFLQRYSIDILTVRDAARKSPDLYLTTGQPETFVIDSSGMVRRKFWGPVDWTSKEVLDYLSKL